MTDNITPIKRSKELVSLSKEHHDGLLLCWKINEGLAKEIPSERITAYILYFFDQHLRRHFEDEEKFIFPLLAPETPGRKEAELHHKLLRELTDNFRYSHQVISLSLRYFAEILNKHIRFEERVLFPLIEKEATAASLLQAEKQLTLVPKCEIMWEDQFWISKK